MQIDAYFRSLTVELSALKERVRDFIADQHWLTDGEWKETVIRHFLRRSLPSSVAVGRGFVVTPHLASSQLDVVIYKSSVPVLFRDGDLVFLTPDSVVGVIEVKTAVTPTSLLDALTKLGNAAALIGTPGRSAKLFALFAFESSVTSQRALECAREAAGTNPARIIDLMCLGDSQLIEYWHCTPEPPMRPYKHWHSYTLNRTAPGYFLHEVIGHVSPESVRDNQPLWFPEAGKERYKDADLAFAASTPPEIPRA